MHAINSPCRSVMHDLNFWCRKAKISYLRPADQKGLRATLLVDLIDDTLEVAYASIWCGVAGVIPRSAPESSHVRCNTELIGE